MSEYYEKERLVAACHEKLSEVEHLMDRFGASADHVYAIVDLVGNFPTATEVAPVRHGKWEYEYENNYGTSFWRCSLCNRRVPYDAHKNDTKSIFPYCHCGAKMDGGTEDGT